VAAVVCHELLRLQPQVFPTPRQPLALAQVRAAALLLLAQVLALAREALPLAAAARAHSAWAQLQSAVA